MKDPSPIALGLKWWQAKRGRKGDDDDDEHEHEHEHDWGKVGCRPTPCSDFRLLARR
jgi:hypothetical protein